MKRLILYSFVTLIIGFCFSIKAESLVPQQKINQKFNLMSENKIRIKIGEKTFISTLSDNPTATAFKALLPLSINMNELNNNEKFADLSKNLPINASVPPSIHTGDLMMYGSRTLVLFYKGFSTSYSYTKIGKIDDVTGIAAALGSGDVNVSFELQ